MTEKVDRTMTAAKLIAMKAEYDKAVKEQSRPLLKEIFELFFASCPEAKIVTWTQGTPSFNDGNPCYFSVGDIYVGTDEGADIEHAYKEASFANADQEPYVKHDYGSPPKYEHTVTVLDEVGRVARLKIDEATQALYRNLRGLEDMMEAAFGNGAQVKVTYDRNGEAVFSFEDYYVE